MKFARPLLFALVALAVAGFVAAGFGEQLTLAALKARQAEWAALLATHPVEFAVAYFAVYVAATALSLPGAALLTLAGGALFGLLWGTLIVSFASTIGATLAFLVARFLLRDAVAARFAGRLAAIDEGVRRDGAFYLFTLRLIPVVPFFLINLLMGLTAMPARTFFWVSQLGMLAGTVVYVNAGTELARVDSLAGIVSPQLLGAFALLGVFPWLARRLVRFVELRRIHAGWKRPARFERNLVVIGGGSAGLVAAYIAAALKAKVTLIEGQRMGGDCLNTGCVPSKALLRAARVVAECARAKDFGVAVAPPRVDFAAVMARVRGVVAAVAPHDSAARYESLGVEVIDGKATIVSPWCVAVTRPDGTTTALSTRAIVVAAGARPVVPTLPGLAEVGYLTSETLWDLAEPPPRLLVLGGGPIGCELALAFARLGSRVVLVELAPRLLPREDAEASALVAARFRAEGVEVLTGHRALRFERAGDGKRLVAECEGGEVAIDFDEVLLALGRAARLEGYGLEALGLAGGRCLAVNEFMQTRYPSIYAAGDVAGPYQFTHVAAHQAWYAAVNALFDPWKKFRADYRVIPWATFVDPEVARVGLGEAEAREQGVAYELTRYGIDDLDRALADGEAHGFVKVLTVPGRDRILGATICGTHAAELIASFVLAMRHGIGMNRLLATIHIYPTFAEANKYAAGAWKRAHAPAGLLAWVERFHAWRRGGR